MGKVKSALVLALGLLAATLGAQEGTGTARVSLSMAEGQHFKIRGATMCHLLYEGEGGALANGRDIVLTLPPFFKFITTPVRGDGYTVTYTPVSRGGFSYISGGVPLPAKYYTAAYGTIETNATELLAFEPYNLCEQLTIHLDSTAASRQFNLGFAIQIDPTSHRKDYTDESTGQVVSMSGVDAYRQLGELMVQAGAHCDAIPLNICTYVVDAETGTLVCEDVYNGTSQLTNEEGTEPIEGDFVKPSADEPYPSYIQHGYNMRNERPRFDTGRAELVDFGPWYYPYTDIQIYFPIPSAEGMVMRYYGEGMRQAYTGLWADMVSTPLAEIEAACAKYPVVEINGKRYWLVYDITKDPCYPVGQTQINAADKICDDFAYVFPHRDTLLPDIPIEFGDVLMSYTHKGKRVEAERLLTFAPFTFRRCNPTLFVFPYNDAEKDYVSKVGAARPQGLEDAYMFALLSSDYDGMDDLGAAYHKAHFAIDFPWEINPLSVTFDDGSLGIGESLTSYVLGNESHFSPTNSLIQDELPTSVTYYYYGDATPQTLEVTGREAAFPDDPRHIRRIVFNYDLLPAFSLCRYLVHAQNMTVNQSGTPLPERQPCFFTLEMTTDADGGRSFANATDNPLFEPTGSTSWAYNRDRNTPGRNGVYLVRELDTLQFGVCSHYRNAKIACHGLRKNIGDSYDTSSDYTAAVSIRKLDDNTKDYVNCRITFEPETAGDLGGMGLISGMQSDRLVIGEDVDKVDITLYSNLRPEGFPAPEPESKYDHGFMRTKWFFNLPEGEHLTRITVDLGTVYTDTLRLPAASTITESGWPYRQGQMFGNGYYVSNQTVWRSVLSFGLLFNDDVCYFKGTDEACAIPDGDVQNIKATFTTDSTAQYINGGGPESYPTAVISATLISRFDAWFGYTGTSMTNFKENGKAKDNAAYQGSGLSFTISTGSGGAGSANTINFFKAPPETFTDLVYANYESTLHTFFSNPDTFPYRGRVYFECPRGIAVDSVVGTLWANSKSFGQTFTPTGSKQLANGNVLYWFEADVSCVPGSFALTATVSPAAAVGTYPPIVNWGYSMDDFAARHLVDGFEGRFSNYACHFEQTFPAEWEVTDTHVLAAGSSVPAKILETSLDGVILHPGMNGALSFQTGSGPNWISLYNQTFQARDKTNLLAEAWMMNGTPSLIKEYRAEILLPRQGEGSPFAQEGTEYMAQNQFSLFLTGPCECQTESTTISNVVVTYYDDDHVALEAPATAEDFARVRIVGISFCEFNAKDLVTLRLPLMTDYEKLPSAAEKAYVMASGEYRNSPTGAWLPLKDTLPVMYTFNSDVEFTIRKEVTGNAEPEREYSFTVSITANGSSLARVAYKGLGGKPDGVQMLGYNTELKLKAGEGILVEGLAPNSRITVQEKDYAADGFLTYATVEKFNAAKVRKDNLYVSETMDYGPCEIVYRNHKGPYASLVISALKTVNGKTADYNYFQFRLQSIDEYGTPLPDGYSLTANDNQGEGRINFPVVKFTELGDHWFQIDEVKISHDRYIFDESVFRIRVHVYEDGEEYRAMVTDFYKVDENGHLQPVDSIVFNNVRKPEVAVRYHWVGEEFPTDTEPPDDDVILKGAEYWSEFQYPTEQNFVFDGWFVDETCTERFVDGTLIYEDQDLYGVWTKVELAEDEVLVNYIWDPWSSYDGMPTDVRPPTYDIVKRGTVYRAKTQDPSEQGFTFTGWYDWDWWEDFEEGVIEKNTTLLGYWEAGGIALMIVDHEDPGDGYVYLAFVPQFNQDLPHPAKLAAWRRLRAAYGLRAKRGASRLDMEKFAPENVQLSDLPAHAAATDRVWVKVPLGGLDQDTGYWRVTTVDPELSFKDFDDTLVDPPSIRSSYAEYDARSVNVFGILKVMSANTNTLVAIPWTWYSAQEKNAAHILANKLVKTTNLTVGDRLYAHIEDGDGLGHYAAWILEEDGWKASSTAANDGEDGLASVVCVGDDTTRVPRGNGVWLVRQHPFDVVGGVTNPVPFWVYGQSVTNAVETPILPGPGGTYADGSVKAHSTILGNPYGQPTRVNDLVLEGSVLGGGVQGDCIVVPCGASAEKRLYRGFGPQPDKWCWAKTEIAEGRPRTTYDYNVTVPAGLAFWYERRGTTDDLKVIWPYQPDLP